jgi:hypothetical protein
MNMVGFRTLMLVVVLLLTDTATHPTERRNLLPMANPTVQTAHLSTERRPPLNYGDCQDSQCTRPT